MRTCELCRPISEHGPCTFNPHACAGRSCAHRQAHALLCSGHCFAPTGAKGQSYTCQGLTLGDSCSACLKVLSFSSPPPPPLPAFHPCILQPCSSACASLPLSQSDFSSASSHSLSWVAASLPPPPRSHPLIASNPRDTPCVQPCPSALGIQIPSPDSLSRFPPYPSRSCPRAAVHKCSWYKYFEDKNCTALESSCAAPTTADDPDFHHQFPAAGYLTDVACGLR